MKIFIPFAIKDIGGTSTFVEKFSRKILENSLVITHTFTRNFDTLFIVSDCPIRYPIFAKLFGKKVIQRVDGIYHRATPAGRLYPLYNLKIQIIHNWLADTVIYQSEFSKLCCEKFLGKTRAKRTAIIYNGVDTEKIRPKNTPFQETARVQLLTFAKFRRRDQIEPIIESVKLLNPEKFSLDIYGSYTENLSYLFKTLPEHIRFRGKKENRELLNVLNQYDIFLFSDQSACPNSVLEAMAAGLPIVAFNRGSIPELIKSGYNGEIADIKENSDPFMDDYPFENTQYQEFSEEIKKVSENINQYTKNTYSTVIERFTINQMMHEYIDTGIKL